VTKQSGMGMTVAVDSSAPAVEAIGNDITNLSFATPRGVQDITGVNSSAMERLLLLADFSITINGPFNPASSPSSHDVFSTVPSTSVTRTVTIVVGGKTLPNEVLFSDYALNRGADGSLTFTASGALNSTVVPTWA